MSTDDKPDPLPPEYLSVVDTQDLINELRDRSEVFFCCFRPKVQKDYRWQSSWGGDIERVLALIQIANHDLLTLRADGEESPA